MTQYLVTGNTFQTGDEVTAVKLNNSINNATLQNVDRVAMGSTSKIVTVGTARPTSNVAAGELFYDSTNDRLEVYTSNGWRTDSSEVTFYVTNNSGGALAVGDVVIFDSTQDSSVTTTTTEGDGKWAGVVTEGGADGTEIAVARGGIRTVNTTGTVNRGDFLFTSTTVKLAKGDTSGDGHFGIALTAAAGGTCTAALHQQAISAVPTGAIVIFNGAACPTGYTNLAALQGKYAKGVADGGAAATGGVNSYTSAYLTSNQRRDADPAPHADSAIKLSNTASSKKLVALGVIQSGLMEMDDTEPDGFSGDHQHTLNGTTNEPAFYTVLYCQKD